MKRVELSWHRADERSGAATDDPTLDGTPAEPILQSDCIVSMAQIEPTLGDLTQNLELHLEAIDQAVKAGSHIVLFPELSLTGYFLKDQFSEVASSIDSAELRTLRKRSKDISIGVGFVERGDDDRIYNSWVFFEDGEVLHVHRKVHLVDYGMFEESRDLATGSSFCAFNSKHGRFGVLLCEDAWHAASAYLYFLAGVDAFLVPSSGPGRGVSNDSEGLASSRTWNTLCDSMALLYQSYILYVNRVGFEDGVLFGGGSRAVDPFGQELVRAEGLDPCLLQVPISASGLRRARTATPLRRDEKPWLVARELKRLEQEGLAE